MAGGVSRSPDSKAPSQDDKGRSGLTWRQRASFEERFEKCAVVDTDFGRDEVVEQSVHAQNRFAVFLRRKDQVMHFMRVGAQVEELHVVVLENFLERCWHVEGGRRIVATKLVPSIERKRNQAALRQFRL